MLSGGHAALLLRLLGNTSTSTAAPESLAAAAAGAAAAGARQILVQFFSCSASSSNVSNSSSLRWNAMPHALPQLSARQLQVPAHELEEGLPEVSAWLRQQTGTNRCTKLRRGGVTPCVLTSLPGNTTLNLALSSRDAARLVRAYGRNGLQAQVLRLNIYAEQPAADAAAAPEQQQQQADASNSSRRRGAHRGGGDAQPPTATTTQQQQQEGEQQQTQMQQAGSTSAATSSSSSSSEQPPLLASVRVLAKAVHVNAVSQEVENLKLLFCPRERRVRVNIPVKLWNDDISPGVRSGGWLHVVNRTIPVFAQGAAVTPFIELDMKSMRNKDVLRYRDVKLPPGCVLRVRDPLQPVVRCAARVGGD